MRARALLAGTLLGLGASVLPGIPRAAEAAQGAPIRITLSSNHVDVGARVRLTARVRDVARGRAMIEERTADGWHTVARAAVRHHVLHTGIVPESGGRHVYELRVVANDGRLPARTTRFVVRARQRPRPQVETGWTYDGPGRATTTVFVRLSRWLPARPRLVLEQQVSGTWRRVAAAAASRPGTADRWQARIDGAVTEPGPLRIVGSGPDWRISRSIPSYFHAAGELVVDGAPVTVPPVGEARRLTFRATAGEELLLLKDGVANFRLRGPDGREVVVGDGWDRHRIVARGTGRYDLDVIGLDPVTLRLGRVVRATAPVDGSSVPLPSVSDPRVPRRVVFAAHAGDIVTGLATVPYDTPSGQAQCSWQLDGRFDDPTWQAFDYPLAVVVGATGTYEATVTCPTTDPATVRLDQPVVYDATANGTPLTVATTRPDQAIALRYSLAADDAVDVTHSWPDATSFGWVLPHQFISRWTATPSTDRGVTGENLVLVRPRLTGGTLAGTVTLTQRAR